MKPSWSKINLIRKKRKISLEAGTSAVFTRKGLRYHEQQFETNVSSLWYYGTGET